MKSEWYLQKSSKPQQIENHNEKNDFVVVENFDPVTTR